MACGRNSKTMNHTHIGWLCPKHYQQYIKHGHPIDNIARSENDPNNIILEKDYAKIELYNSKQKIVGYCLIDIEDIKRCTLHKWRLWENTVVTGNNINYPITQIDYFILNYNTQIEFVVDHINGNRLDNRKSNLRIIHQSENTYNRHFMSNNTTGGILGIWYDKSRNKYVAEISYKHTKYRFGKRCEYKEAVYIRWIAEHLLFKEFRSENNDNQIRQIISSIPLKRQQDLNEYVENVINNKNLKLKESN